VDSIHPEDTIVNQRTRTAHTRVLLVVAVLMPMLCGAGAPPAAIGVVYP
jgi:hypothetical protein